MLSSHYDEKTMISIRETYDVVKVLHKEAYRTTTNPQSTKKWKFFNRNKNRTNNESISSNDGDNPPSFSCIQEQPPIEHVLEIIPQISQRRLDKIKQSIHPNRFYKILNREPVAHELVVPKKATELLKILLDSEINEIHQKEEYTKVLKELNALLNDDSSEQSSRNNNGQFANGSDNNLKLVFQLTHQIR